jgi:uncharacterized protein (DUF488 family)
MDEHLLDAKRDRVHGRRGMSTIYTIGHSTRSATAFVALLRSCQVTHVIDVRSKPASTRFPHFNKEVMKNWLREQDIHYSHIKDLGGYPAKYRTRVDNSAWKSPHFRNFADYMQSPRFAEAMRLLEVVATAPRAAIMCSEADPAKCHRSLISDFLMARGWRVRDILDQGQVEDATMHTFAVVKGGNVNFPVVNAS